MIESKLNVQKASITSMISLYFSIVAMLLYFLVFEGFDVQLFCVTLSIVALIFPIASKYYRRSRGLSGKGFEIVALVLGSFDFYNVMFVATNIDVVIILGIIIVCCTVYALLFNRINTNINYVHFEIGNHLKYAKIMPTIIIIINTLISAVMVIFYYSESRNVDDETSLCFAIIAIVFTLLSLSSYYYYSKKSWLIFSCVMTFSNIFYGLFLFAWLYELLDYYSIDDKLDVFCVGFSFILCVIICILYIAMICKLIAAYWRKSIKYRERRFKKVAKIHEYYTSGVITLEEFEKTKKDILKHIS